MTPRSFAWLAPLLITATLCAQYGRAPASRAPAGRAPAPGPARTPTGQPATPSPATVGMGKSPARVPPAPAPSRFPPGSPDQAVSPLEDPAAAGLGNGGRGVRPVRPASPTLDSVAASPAEKKRALKAAREFRSLKVPGRKVAPAVRKVLRLRWHKTLKEAAAKSRKEHKPILWIQSLGDLRGYT